MTRFIARRLWHGLITLFILSLFVFVLSRLTGDPITLMLPIDASPERIASVERQLGLDASYPEQYGRFLINSARGDFGTSIRHREPAWDLFWDFFPNSLRLVLPSFILASAVSIPLAVIAATTKSRAGQQALTVFSTLGLATPMFWLGIMFILLFSVRLGWLPSARMGGLSHYVMPVSVLALFLLSGMMRLIRSSMLDSMASEYIKLARIKGASERSVVWHHALRNSLTSGLAFLSVYFASLMTGTIVIEKLFAWPGTGRLVFDAITTRDYPLVQGIILISAALIVLSNIFFDICQAYVDPRVRL